MVVNCEIDFDNNPHGVYPAGQVIIGKVILKADSPKKVQAVFLRITGIAHTKWTEKGSRNVGQSKVSRDTVFQAHKEYFNCIIYLLGTRGIESLVIEAGTYNFNFSCPLPYPCATSFEGQHGYIRYTAQVVLQRSWKYDIFYTRGFTVIKLLGFRENALRQGVIPARVEKLFAGGPYATDPLKVLLYAPQSAYATGQRIHVSVLVSNTNGSPIETICVRLVMSVSYNSHTPKKNQLYERVSVTQSRKDFVSGKCEKLLQYELPVPATPVSDQMWCKLIQISYEVELEAKAPGIDDKLTMCMPVTIVNEPLLNTSSGLGVITGNDELLILPPWELDADLPIPSYEVAAHISPVNLKALQAHEYGMSAFVPKYPVFHLPSPQAAIEEELKISIH